MSCGANCVAPISNWNTHTVEVSVKDIGKLYGIPFGEVNLVTNANQEATPLQNKSTVKAGMYTPTWEEVLDFLIHRHS